MVLSHLLTLSYIYIQGTCLGLDYDSGVIYIQGLVRAYWVVVRPPPPVLGSLWWLRIILGRCLRLGSIDITELSIPMHTWECLVEEIFCVLCERAAWTEPNLQEHYVSQHTEDSIESYKILEGNYGQDTLCSPKENQSLSSLWVKVLKFTWFNHTRRIPWSGMGLVLCKLWHVCSKLELLERSCEFCSFIVPRIVRRSCYLKAQGCSSGSEV